MSYTTIYVRKSSRDKLDEIKGENPLNAALSAVLSFFSLFTAENKKVFSYLMREGARSIFIGGFLYRKLCNTDPEFLKMTINLAESLSLAKFHQLAMIMSKEVRRRPEFEKYVGIADEMDDEMIDANYDHVVTTDTVQILFELGVGFQI